jgi:hypothetical protein
MPKPSKPTGAELYKRWMEGWSFYSLWMDSRTRGIISQTQVEVLVRAYLRRRDKRRRGK